MGKEIKRIFICKINAPQEKWYTMLGYTFIFISGLKFFRYSNEDLMFNLKFISLKL